MTRNIETFAFLSSGTPESDEAMASLVQVYGQTAPKDADVIIALGGDGFMLSPIYTPGAIEEFVDLVVPELQRRGLYRTDYAGVTQRDHLRQND